MDEAAIKKLYELGIPTYSRFICPTDRRHTPYNVNMLRTAERELDDFWTFVDQNVLNNEKKTYHDLVAGYLSFDRKIHRTRAWEERTSTSSSEKPVTYEYIPIPATKHEKETQITGNFDRRGSLASIS